MDERGDSDVDLGSDPFPDLADFEELGRPSWTPKQEMTYLRLLSVVDEHISGPEDVRWLRFARQYAVTWWDTRHVEIPDYPVD